MIGRLQRPLRNLDHVAGICRPGLRIQPTGGHIYVPSFRISRASLHRHIVSSNAAGRRVDVPSVHNGLRTELTWLHAVAGLRCYGTRHSSSSPGPPRRRRERHRNLVVPKLEPDSAIGARELDALQRLGDGINDSDLRQITGAYSHLRGLCTFGARDMLMITSALRRINHQLSKQGFPRSDHQLPGSDLIDFVKALFLDMESGVAPADPSALAHLLEILGEARQYPLGHEIWSRMSGFADGTLRSPEVYASYMTLCARQGGRHHQVEALFNEAVATSFYAVLQATLAPNVGLANYHEVASPAPYLSNLMEALCLARLAADKESSAYKALDTMLLQMPTTTDNLFLQMFIEKRPLSEAYTTFMLSCLYARAAKSHPQFLNMILEGLNRANAPGDSPTIVATIRASIRAFYAYCASGQSLTGRNCGELSLILIRALGPIGSQPIELDAICSWLRSLLDIAEKVDMALPPITIMRICRALAPMRQHSAADEIVSRLMNSDGNIAMSQVDGQIRYDIERAGFERDGAKLESAWSVAKSHAGGASHLPIRLLARAAIQCNQVDHFFVDMMKMDGHEKAARIWESAIADFQRRSERPTRDHPQQIDQRSQDIITKDMQLLREAVLSERVSASDLIVLPKMIGRLPSHALESEAGLRQFYERLTSSTLDWSGQDTRKETDLRDYEPMALALPVTELRYQNWCVVNDLLVESERYHEYAEQVSTGEPGMSRADAWTQRLKLDLQGSEPLGLSDVLELGEGGIRVRSEWSQPRRVTEPETIKRIRGS